MRVQLDRVRMGIGILLALAAALSYLRLLIALGFGIWPPTAMVHEVSGTNFVAYPLFRIGFFLIETGHFSILCLNYPASAAVECFLHDASNFTKLRAFCPTFSLGRDDFVRPVEALIAKCLRVQEQQQGCCCSSRSALFFSSTKPTSA
ncbi:hypothetical protein AYO40_05635 [Planctomycetaceae bacterium SCGC AG-212-D15]|nr:hypothetical protein AYO40_05635 [Planctomycetaceae bacterium SCGC AG-212-D15]